MSEWDFRDFEVLAADLTHAARDDVREKVRAVVVKGAVNVKAAMRADMRTSRHFRQVAPKITFDTTVRANSVTCDVGPITQGQVVGDLAHFAYFGGANGGGGTVRDPQAALEDEAPQFFAAISDVLDALI